MTKGTFTKAKEAEVILSNCPNSEFGLATINKAAICAIRSGNKITPFDDQHVNFVAPLKKGGKSAGLSAITGAVAHAAFSTIVPGAGLAGTIARNAAGAAVGSAASAAVKGKSEVSYSYQEFIVEFRNGMQLFIRCSLSYYKIIKKNCRIVALSDEEIRVKIDAMRNGVASAKTIKRTSNTKSNLITQKSEEIYCAECGVEIFASDKFCHKCGHKNKHYDDTHYQEVLTAQGTGIESGQWRLDGDSEIDDIPSQDKINSRSAVLLAILLCLISMTFRLLSYVVLKMGNTPKEKGDLIPLVAGLYLAAWVFAVFACMRKRANIFGKLLVIYYAIEACVYILMAFLDYS